MIFQLKKKERDTPGDGKWGMGSYRQTQTSRQAEEQTGRLAGREGDGEGGKVSEKEKER